MSLRLPLISLTLVGLLVPFVACDGSNAADDVQDAAPGKPDDHDNPDDHDDAGGRRDATADATPSTDADAATPASPARCGLPPYQWQPSDQMGTILERKKLASHTIVELNYALYEARKQGFKTDRIAKSKTKSDVVRYQTQDRGELIDATATVAYPDKSGTYPILLVLHGTVGFSDQCSPSRHLTDADFGGFTSETGILLSAFASFGYIVVAPDYIGLKSLGEPTGFMHPYLIAEPTALASLDSVRAVKRLLADSSTQPGELVVMGGSQGGHAAAFVNRYAPHYAPELDIKGSVWDVPPTDLLGQAKPALQAWRNASKNTMALVTAADSWYRPNQSELGAALLAPYDTVVPTELQDRCSFKDLIAGATLETVFTPELRTASQQDDFGEYAPWDCYLRENSLSTTSVPKADSIPSMFLLGELDDLVNNDVERAAFEKLCEQGHVLQYLECSGATHTKPLSYAFDQWLGFLEDRLKGKPLTNTCTIHPAERCTSTPSGD